jgi:hypothetical protein
MKGLVIAVLVLAFAIGVCSQSEKAIQTTTFHNCVSSGGTGNIPHRFDVSEVFQCDEGRIEIAGKREMAIEYGTVFETEMGRPSGEPHKATAANYKDYKWCPSPTPQDRNQKEMCGDKPGMCWDGKIGTWDSAWQGYSCATPDHHN